MKNKSKLVQQTMLARKNVRNLAVYLLPGDKCEIINMNTFEPDEPDYHKHADYIKRLSREDAMVKLDEIDREHSVDNVRCMTQFKHNWSVLLFVCGRCPIEGSYWKTFDTSPPGKFYSEQLEESLREHHTEMVKNFNKQQFVSLGWIARPVDAMYDNDVMYDLFMKLGAWDYLAPWETAEL